MTILWGEEYWAAAAELDGGSGNLHALLSETRALLERTPYYGAPSWGTEGLYTLRVSIVQPLLTVQITYVVIPPFVALLRVEQVAEG